MKKRFYLLTIFLLLLLSACGTSPSSSEESKGNTSLSTLEKAKKEGSITIGFANEKPFAYQDENGKLTGEAVEVARAVLKNLGINEMKGVLTEFGSLIPGLNAKRFDMITAGMYITPERCEEVIFANPEYTLGAALGVKANNPLNLKSYEDIKSNPNAKVGVMAGAIEHNYLKDSGIPEKQISIVPDIPSAISALLSGRVDAVTMTGPSLEAMLESANSKEIVRVKDFEQPIINGNPIQGYGASAFRKEDTEFRDAFNAELQKLKESGELLKIIEPFGFTENELPGETTADELCK
ncbi:ectoine/hydroxyectoine ABC transporter substrate-binding protein EhuB [Neobacillus thermocopriae]|uniref:Ectoine/hydroxyectoine ABC transporter substrate-binding protein EhuB n=1 Tax=Neobacillus thermocopriae TaxID=1215031 RepID=A0A6B3TP10_9BACI|nr:ectoine/hydroxyectoine ABC transporter substrate-binding protein EhuB [Neobacillus thermocopriae]MED3624086.1 ectoine/hydroxyectoine ABC transporter substrate-binding protein EhuB [Neobacillus thermocopriae]MED3713719.1 ectoine/hydroxyectoine ABC transporter substrate-binding protein EhuB [Neobacillus thermocopriae]NEX78136.1 ectoine/hydroxyectoine ABC transporter substrate-binding protein EhuB [Neobacillus thermocopriae]